MQKNQAPTTPAGIVLRNRSGSSLKGLLFVLLALAVCFGYFYFFTDVLRSRSELAGQSDLYVTEMRKPLPERPGQSPVAPESAGTTDQPVAEEPAQVSSSAPEDLGNRSLQHDVKQAPDAVESKKAGGAVAPAVRQTSSRHVDRTPVTPSADKKSVTKPVLVSPPAAPKPKAEHAAGKVSSVSAHSAAPIKTGVQTKAGVPADASRASGSYYLVVGTYVLKPTVSADKARLEKAGLRPEITPGEKKAQAMNRLLIADVSSRAVAQAELQRVKKESSGAFMVTENGKYLVYAGSYYTAERAGEEQKRLREKGFMPIVKAAPVPVSTYVLKVGRYTSRVAAEKDISRLQGMGFKPRVVTISPQ